MILKTLNLIYCESSLSSPPPSLPQACSGFRMDNYSKVAGSFSSISPLHISSPPLPSGAVVSTPQGPVGLGETGKGDTQGSSNLNQYFCHLLSLESSRCLFPLRCHFPGLFRVFSLFFSFSYNSLDLVGCFSYFSVLTVTCDSFLSLWTSCSASPCSFRELYWTEPRLSPS